MDDPIRKQTVHRRCTYLPANVSRLRDVRALAEAGLHLCTSEYPLQTAQERSRGVLSVALVVVDGLPKGLPKGDTDNAATAHTRDHKMKFCV